MVPLLMESGPFCVLFIIVSNRVVLLLEGFHKICPSEDSPKNINLVYGVFLTVSVPSIFDMWHGLKECKDKIFCIVEVVDGKIAHIANSTIYLGHQHLSDLQIKGNQS